MAQTTELNHTVTNERKSTLSDPISLREIVTEFPVPTDFNVNTYHDSTYNGWFPSIENYVESVMDECQKYSYMHAEANKVYNRRYQVITISLIILPLLSGAIVLTTFAEKNLVMGIIALLGVAVGSLNKVMEFSEKSYIHRISSDQFMKLQGSIAEQLMLPLDRRYNGVEFQRWCRITFFTIKEHSPYPDKRKIKRLIERRAKQSTTETQLEPIREPTPIPAPAPIPAPEPIPAPAPTPSTPSTPSDEIHIVPHEPTTTESETERYRKYLFEQRGYKFKADPNY
jgi:hypothetical protein